MKSLCVMPVYNQAEQLPALLEKCHQCMPADYLFIVDNGSDDGSTELIEQSGFEFTRLDKNWGIGYALRLGVEKALENNCDIVANIAGNGKMLPEEMHRILDPIKKDEADYVTGSRFLKGGQSPNLPIFRKVTIPLVVNNLIRILFWTKLSDATNGFRAYKLTMFKENLIDWKAEWLYHYQFEYYVYAKAIKLGYRCIEVPSSMIYPKSGKNYSKIKYFIGWWEMLEPWILVGLGLK